MKLNETTNKYNVGDVVYIKPGTIKKKPSADGHPFLIMSIENGKYHGVEISHGGKPYLSQNHKFTSSDIPGVGSGMIKSDNIVWLEDSDIDRKKNTGKISQQLFNDVYKTFSKYNSFGKKNREFLEELQNIVNNYYKINECISLKQFYESKGDVKMAKYKIDFEYDLEPIEEENNEGMYTINYIEDKKFASSFDSKKDVEDFNKWYNSNYEETDEEYIKIENVELEVTDDGGYLIITTNKDLDEDEQNDLKSESLTYLFDDWTKSPEFHVNFTGTSYRDVWNYYRQEPAQELFDYDYDEVIKIHDYSTSKISKVD